jgi:hypothetical protein
MDPNRYKDFNKANNLVHKNQMSYVMNSVELLQRFDVNVSELLPHMNDIDNFKHIVLNYLITGRNCGDCCFIELGDKIREQYIVQTKKQLGIME